MVKLISAAVFHEFLYSAPGLQPSSENVFVNKGDFILTD